MSEPTLKQVAEDLRQALERGAMHSERVAALYRETQRQIPEEPDNAPLVAAQRMLERFGFVVLHIDRVREAMHIVRLACEADHEDRFEGERLERLLAYMAQQARETA